MKLKDLNAGDILYWYSLKKDGSLSRQRGRIKKTPYNCDVYLSESKKLVIGHDEDEIGVMNVTGKSLWLLNKEDEIAKRLFIKNCEESINELQIKIDKLKNTIVQIKNTEI